MKKNIEINIPEGWEIDVEKLESCITSNNTNLLIPLKKIENKLEYPKIISFRENDTNNLFILTNGGYKDYACNNIYPLDVMLYNSMSLKFDYVIIYQVAQSENEIFTLGDNVKNVDNKIFKIAQFIIDNKYGIIAKDNKNSEYVEYLKRIESSIFLTEDKIEIFNEAQYVYGVCVKANWQISECNVSSILRSREQKFSPSYNSNTWKFFSTKEARDDYRDNNMPKFSKTQILEAMKYPKHKNNGQKSSIMSEIKLKENLGI